MGSSRRFGGSWGQLFSPLLRAAFGGHRACVRAMASRGRDVDSCLFSTVCLLVTPRSPAVVLVLSQACPQRYPQPVCTDCYGQHCCVAAHPDRACCLMRLVSSVTWL